MSKKKGSRSYKRKLGDHIFSVSVTVVSLIMMGVFVYYTALAFQKYWLQEVVKERYKLGNTTARLPPITICLMPGYKKEMNVWDQLQFQSYCKTDEEKSDVKKCFDDMRFDVEDIVSATMRLGATEMTPLNKSWFPPTSFNIWFGSCITYQRPGVTDLVSQAIVDGMVMPMTAESKLSQGWAMYMLVSNEDRFLPMMGIAPSFIGQHFAVHTPERNTMSFLELEITHNIRLNTENHRCNTDPNYSIVQCYEQCVQVPECETYEEFAALFLVHRNMNMVTNSNFETLCNCPPPCQYDTYDILIRRMQNPVLTAGMFENVTSVGVSLRSADTWIVRDALLYDLDKLVGDVGGYMGMFLGVSFLTIYNWITRPLERYLRPEA